MSARPLGSTEHHVRLALTAVLLLAIIVCGRSIVVFLQAQGWLS